MSELEVLDPQQLIRIEAVHRGFLYQHLYAVGCLLLANGTDITGIRIESDEDIEVFSPDKRIYIQVKTRIKNLIPSDIDGALERFTELREAHQAHQRQEKAEFWVVSNAQPGPKLSEMLNSESWPEDTLFRFPGEAFSEKDPLPPAWKNIFEGVVWCAKKAEELPFLTLKPETLAWKLTGHVLLASSGSIPYQDHCFLVEKFPALFEQLCVQLQQFPSPLNTYRPQTNEPELESPSRVRVICGFSGSGKTAWASQVATYGIENLSYFDMQDIPGAAMATALSRELIGRFFENSSGVLGEILLPGASGLEVLRAFDNKLKHEKLSVTVVIDNAHRASIDEIRPLIEGTNHLKIIFLCQPGPLTNELQATQDLELETLEGWSVETVAAEASGHGCRANYGSCQNLIKLTGGLPLFIQSAVQITSRHYDGDLCQFCSELEGQTHIVTTAQEIIIARIFNDLSEKTKNCIGALSLSDLPISIEEASILVAETFDIEFRRFAAVRRDIFTAGILEIFGNTSLKIHDSVRVLGVAHLEGDKTKLQNAQESLKRILFKSIIHERDIPRFRLYVRLLSLTGEIETIIDLAGEELFHELSLGPEFLIALEEAVIRGEITPEQTYWALDGLVFAYLKEEGHLRVGDWLEEMARLVNDHSLGVRERLGYSMKRIIYLAYQADDERLDEEINKAKDITPEDPSYKRILLYNIACAYQLRKRHNEILVITSALIDEYYEHLGLMPEDVILKNPEEIRPKLKKDDSVQDDLKHVADCLDLHAKCSNELGIDSGFARIHALKFYEMAGAIDSALKVGQDFADELIARGDYFGARQFLEGTLIPAANRLKVVSRIVPIRSQYAVILAYCGEFNAAHREMDRLKVFEAGQAEIGQAELRNQRLLITHIQDQHLRQQQFEPTNQPKKKKVGRNERCPCGSGEKYKRCHGK